MGVRGSVVEPDQLPWRWSLGVVLAGVAILVLDTVIAEISLSVRRHVSFVPQLRRVLLLRVTAVGSLLSMAPIWVIGLKESYVLAPLLAITTLLVFVSTRRAHDRAHEADHDPLTGLANRRTFAEQLMDACWRARSTGQRGAPRDGPRRVQGRQRSARAMTPATTSLIGVRRPACGPVCRSTPSRPVWVATSSPRC